MSDTFVKKEREIEIFGSRETVDMADTVGISKRVDKKERELTGERQLTW